MSVCANQRSQNTDTQADREKRERESHRGIVVAVWREEEEFLIPSSLLPEENLLLSIFGFT